MRIGTSRPLRCSRRLHDPTVDLGHNQQGQRGSVPQAPTYMLQVSVSKPEGKVTKKVPYYEEGAFS